MGIMDGFSVIGDIDTLAEGGKTPSWYASYDKDFPGSFSVTLGTSLTSCIYGGRQTHIFGDEIKFVVDYETLIASLLGQIPGGVGEFLDAQFGSLAYAVLGGTGGNITMGLGNNASCAYVGPKYAIDRVNGPIIKVPWEKGFFGGGNWKDLSLANISTAMAPQLDPATGKADPALQKKIMALTGVLVLILLVLMCLIALALELLAILKYPDIMKKTSKDEYDIAVVELLRDLDTTLTARIMAFILVAERMAAIGVSGIAWTTSSIHEWQKLGTFIQNGWNRSIKPTLLKIGRLGGDSAEEGLQRWKTFAKIVLYFFAGVVALTFTIGIAFGVAFGVTYLSEHN